MRPVVFFELSRGYMNRNQGQRTAWQASAAEALCDGASFRRDVRFGMPVLRAACLAMPACAAEAPMAAESYQPGRGWGIPATDFRVGGYASADLGKLEGQ